MYLSAQFLCRCNYRTFNYYTIVRAVNNLFVRRTFFYVIYTFIMHSMYTVFVYIYIYILFLFLIEQQDAFLFHFKIIHFNVLFIQQVSQSKTIKRESTVGTSFISFIFYYNIFSRDRKGVTVVKILFTLYCPRKLIIRDEIRNLNLCRTRHLIQCCLTQGINGLLNTTFPSGGTAGFQQLGSISCFARRY